MAGGNMGDMLRQAQKMQKQMAKVQEELKERIVEESAGGGMVTALMNGHQDLVSIKINPEVVDPEDTEMLEDLILSAIRQANKKSKDMAQDAMGKLTGGLNLPGMF